MGCPIVSNRPPLAPLDLEYRDGRLSFEAHAFEFASGWDCAFEFKYRSDYDGESSGKGGWWQAAKPTRAEAIASVLRDMLTRMDRTLTPGHWSFEQHKERNAAYAKFRAWLLDTLAAWDMPLFAGATNEH